LTKYKYNIIINLDKRENLFKRKILSRGSIMDIIDIMLDIIKKDTTDKLNDLCNKKAKELFINYIQTAEGDKWLNDTYIGLLKNNPIVEDAKEIIQNNILTENF